MTEDWNPETHPERRKEAGFLIRYELLGIIAIMILQLVGAIWWASSMSSDVRYMRADMIRLTSTIDKASADRYRSTDAQKDFFAVYQRLERNEARILKLETEKS